MALDPGTRRVGVAISDPTRTVASPLEVIDAGDAVGRVGELVAEYQPDLIVIGLPVSLAGGEGAAAAHARAFAREVETATGVPVELFDERFTSKSAEQALIEGGVRRRARRGKVDKVAAAVILQQYLARPR